VRFRELQEAATLESLLRGFYANAPWVRIFGAAKLPQIKFCLRTNYCDIGFSLAPDGKRAVLISCLDNLVKGAAGQAVQAFNIALGLDEQAGLV
jgi:N-acetyl-gamma-glutamyl-phosphate reductase